MVMQLGCCVIMENACDETVCKRVARLDNAPSLGYVCHDAKQQLHPLTNDL